MHPTIQLKITLADIKPPIWRRVVVPASLTFEELHHVIQLAMGWDNYHLFEFWDGKRGLSEVRLSPIPPGETAETWFEFEDQRDCALVRLDEVFTTVRQKLLYIYDMGDYWQHTVLVEALGEAATVAAPRCLTGRRACPPEDCGGWPGYEELMEQLKSGKKLPEWLAERADFALEAFSAADVNQALTGLTDYIRQWRQ